MTTRQPHAPLEYYHIYNRGTEKRRIFLSKSDFGRFVSLLYLCNSDSPVHLSNLRNLKDDELFGQKLGKPLVQIGAYCLMPHLFHLLVRQTEDLGISRYMQKLITGYTMYFNKRNERSGVLFQGKYKSVHADSDTYLKYLLSYIHLNPGAAYERYKYSSLPDYITDGRPQSKLLDKECLPAYFTDATDIKRELKEWVQYEPESSIKVRP
ncbi:MAG: transposase [Minisyncoccota bacterium]